MRCRNGNSIYSRHLTYRIENPNVSFVYFTFFPENIHVYTCIIKVCKTHMGMTVDNRTEKVCEMMLLAFT